MQPNAARAGLPVQTRVAALGRVHVAGGAQRQREPGGRRCRNDGKRRAIRAVACNRAHLGTRRRPKWPCSLHHLDGQSYRFATTDAQRGDAPLAATGMQAVD